MLRTRSSLTAIYQGMKIKMRQHLTTGVLLQVPPRKSVFLLTDFLHLHFAFVFGTLFRRTGNL
jgi:hypothetical protein